MSVKGCGGAALLRRRDAVPPALLLISLISQEDGMYSCYRKICVISVICEPYIHLSLADFTDFAE